MLGFIHQDPFCRPILSSHSGTLRYCHTPPNQKDKSIPTHDEDDTYQQVILTSSHRRTLCCLSLHDHSCIVTRYHHHHQQQQQLSTTITTIIPVVYVLGSCHSILSVAMCIPRSTICPYLAATVAAATTTAPRVFITTPVYAISM